ncbi:MAG: TonB-dependent receptor [Flavobacteriales bacterium]|nr:TonB-dependent receptor [Flavobacteriales bacterium]
MVVDGAGGAPLHGVSVVLVPSEPMLGAATDSLGRFRITGVPVGFYTVKAQGLGYEATLIQETWVRAGKETALRMTLMPSAVQLEGFTVVSSAGEGVDAFGARAFTVEQGLRYPAMFQDPARLVTGTPGVAAANDQANHLVVRGNSPNANAWLLEGAEIVSPNHLGNAGTASDLPTLSGGGVNILSAQMLGPSRLRTGVSPVMHGNALGGLMDMELRRGNGHTREWTVQAGLLGIDLSTEGPIGKSENAFHLVNYRYSTLGLLSAMGVDIGDETIRFQDLAVHAGTRIGKRGELRLFGMGGNSSNQFRADADQSTWVFDKDSKDITYTSSMGAGGATAVLPMGQRALLRTTFVWSAAFQDREESDADSTAWIQGPAYTSLYERKLSGIARMEGSIGTRFRYGGGASMMERVMENVLGDKAAGWLIRPFLHARYDVTERIEVTAGLAYSQFTYDASDLIEPRLGVRWRLSTRGAATLAYGVRGQLPYQQIVNLMDLGVTAQASDTPNNRRLGLMRSEDFVIGYEHRIAQVITARAEVYAQRISGVPTPWSGITTGFSTTETITNAWDEPQFLPMETSATAQNIGAELSFARAFDNGYYWQANGSVFRSTYESAVVERPARWDAGWTANALVGREWRKAKEDRVRTWGVGLRALGVGGMRYTPLEAQDRRGAWTFISGEPYSAKLKDVYRLDVRVYLKRDHKGRTGQWAIDLQNATNAENEAYRYFDYRKEETITRYQLGLIPNLSYRIEF